MAYGANKYKKAAVTTASPEQILLMLYEGAIKCCKMARKHFDEKNISGKCEQIGKAHDIVIELQASLNIKANPQVGEQLNALYDFCTKQLLQANLKNDMNALDNARKILETLYAGWVEAVDQVLKERRSNPPESK